MMKKKIIAGAMVGLMGLTGVACTQSERVSHNVSREAENFNVDRRLVVMNTVSHEPLLELTGKFAILSKPDLGYLEVTVEDEDGDYKKHFVGLAPTVAYTVEDVTGSSVSNTRYQISYLPDAIIPAEFKDGTK